MKTKTIRPHRFTGISSLGLAALVTCLFVQGAGAQTLTPLFTSPVTNAFPGAPITVQFEFWPTNTVLSSTILTGTGIVPQANLSQSVVATNIVQLTLMPLTNTSGTVTTRLTGDTNTVDFTAVFRTYPPRFTSPINDVFMDEDTTNTFSFTIADPDSPPSDLVLSAVTSQPWLLDTNGISFGGAGTTNRTMTLIPNPDMNGTNLVTISLTDGEHTVSTNFTLVVVPVPDKSTIVGVTDKSFGDDAPSTNLFWDVVIDDVDHNMPLPEELELRVTIESEQYVRFVDGSTTFVTNGFPANVTAALNGLAFVPRRFQGQPGAVNEEDVEIRVTGVVDGLVTTGVSRLTIEVINTPPTFNILVSPTSIAEGQAPVTPFELDFIFDPDFGDDVFSLVIEYVNPAQSNLLFISETELQEANFSVLRNDLRNIFVQANSGVLTAPLENVDLRFIVTDQHGGSTAETNTIVVTEVASPPVITGIPNETITRTDGSGPFHPLPTVFVQDVDQGGTQHVAAVVSQSNPTLGAFSQTNFVLQSQADLSAALQAMTYTPTPGALPIGQSGDTIVTVTATDSAGLSSANNNLTIRINSINNPPVIENIPSADQQPVLIAPVAPILPFAGVGLTNDDTNNVLFTLSMDNPDKGTLGDLGGFTQTSPGTYQWSGQVNTILSSLTNITYTLNPAFAFPPDDPGGTIFTLSARDFALLTTTRTLYIQVQDEPRNHLVVRTMNDGLPGSFNYALANAGNNDHITFALPEYPAIIRMPGTHPDTLTRNLTIKGPGANLLTISGDNNGDLTPNRQLFRIAARVVIEGVTLSHGTAAFGGAILVQEGGDLTLRNCAVVDSVATQYGGAIDVDGGTLILDGCFIGRNRLDEDTGMSGAGVSVYTDKTVHFINTTFAQNLQPNESGDGGSALVVENLTPVTPMNAYITHCTFAENSDARGRASAVFSVGFGTRVRPRHSVFADFSGRNLEVTGTGEIISLGGNVCDDSTKTMQAQQGQSEEVFLLNAASDIVSTNPLLAPLNLGGDPTPFYEPLVGSPAINILPASATTVDQRGVLRRAPRPDAGAIEFNAAQRLVINEIQFEANPIPFIELYVRRDSTTIDLAPYSVFLDGVRIHDFSSANSTIIGVSDEFGIGDPVNTSVEPGFGMVLALTNGPVALTSPDNPTPVGRLSETNAPSTLEPRGTITIATSASAPPIARQAYLGSYVDPLTGTNLLNTAGNSISLAPQFRGFALAPHSVILGGPFGGVDTGADTGINQQSPGGDNTSTPFGRENALPLAVPDLFTITEDDVGVFNVLLNDFDGDGNDRLVIVNVSETSAEAGGDMGVTMSAFGATVTIDPGASPLRGEQIIYDPRAAPILQALPIGVELFDTFYYEIIDIGSAPIEAIESDDGEPLITSANHRLQTDDEIRITGTVPSAYNGVFAVTRVDTNRFTIPTPFVGATTELGHWETIEPRSPSARSQASVSVRVIGMNDPPTAVLDVITNVTERSTVRIMARPERAGEVLTFPGDPVPAPDPLTQDLLSNDFDVDTDDTGETLRIVGVMGAVNLIHNYSGTPGAQPVTVTSSNHLLSSGAEVLIANYGGHPSYNGYHTITVIDDHTFTIPRFYVDNHSDKGIWVILNESNRYAAVTDVGATVNLTLRADPDEDHVIYDANASSFLRGLAEGKLHTNRFWYAIEDSHGAIGIGPVDVIVEGINDPPVPRPDPDSLHLLLPIVDGTNTLAVVLEQGLDLMYTRPPESGEAERTDLHVLDLGGTIPGTVVLRDFFVTDEDTPLHIDTHDLLANDTDIDRADVLTIVAVDSESREGATLTLSGGVITFDPTMATNLQALAREELLADTFTVVVSDGMTGGSVTSLVAVLVIGVNDTPIANPVFHVTNEDEIFVFDPRDNDIEIDINQIEPDDRLRIVPQSSVPNPGNAAVTMTGANVIHDATVSELLNQLAHWQSFTNVFDYTITDNSFLFAVNDEFHVPAGTTNRVLDVLLNDRDFTDSQGMLTIIDAGPALHGGLVEIAPDGTHLIYSSPTNFVGDDYFRYIIENDKGDVAHGRVMVRSVVPALNGVLHAADDHFTVAAGETAVLNVLANDDMLPATGAALTITELVSSSQPGQPILTNNQFVYEATAGLMPLTFTYRVSADGEATATANVTVQIVERRGILPVRDDMFSVLSGSYDNELNVLANDALVTDSADNLRIKAILDPANNGTITTNASATRLVYTPDPGFVGTEQIRYLATDQIGGTGTGRVSIVVGRVETAPDFYTIRATTNPAPVALDVLANDRMLPNPRGPLTVTSVSPATPTTIGTLAVGAGGANVLFTPTDVIGQMDFDYVVADGSVPPQTATNRVSIATVGNGIFANPNVYVVRGNGTDYILDVLSNDISYPDVNKTYSVIGIGTGPNAPDQGGSVNIVDNKLMYSPAPGFFGEEKFTYTMSDSIGTDIAKVTVLVRQGDLRANDNTYSVFYEVEPGTNTARQFTLPVLLNDRIQPAFDQVPQIVSLGIGTNAPNQGGSVMIAPDGQSLLYRPPLVPAPSYQESFTYEISDGGSRRASARVTVWVESRAGNLVALTQDDRFTVARNSQNNMLNVLANDFVLPGSAAGWSLTDVSATDYTGTVSVVGGQIRYTPPTNFIGTDRFTYTVNDGLGGTGSATVQVRVGSLPRLPSWFTVLSDSTSNVLNVVANDMLTEDKTNKYNLHSVFGLDQGGSASVFSSSEIVYTPSGAYAGSYPYTESFFYGLVDDSGGTVTGRVYVAVHEAGSDRASSTITLLVEGRNDEPMIFNNALNVPITDKQTTQPFTEVLIVEVDEQTLEPVDVLVSLDDPAKGALLSLGPFDDLGGGTYSLTNVTAAAATAAIRQLEFRPTENRITVPTTEVTGFTIFVTDNLSPPVLDTNTAIAVTAVNDPPTLTGTQSGQEFYYLVPIQPFSTVLITEVDDVDLQPLTVTVSILPSGNGTLSMLGDFVHLGGGVYRASGITAADATQQLREMRFTQGPPVAVGDTISTSFRITVDDGFAPPIDDVQSSVIARNAYEGLLRPDQEGLQGAFGLAVDTIREYAVVGAPNSDTNGARSGSAVVYRRTGPASWSEWRVLLPATVTANDRFGRSVAISDDYIAVGAVNAQASGVPAGAVYLFERDLGGANNWGELIRIAPTNVPAGSLFGLSVAIDGDRLAVGAPQAEILGSGAPRGAVFVFERDAGGTNAWGEVLRWTPSSAQANDSDFGWSVALEGDDLLVGAPDYNVDTGNPAREGAVFYLAADTNGWQLAQQLTATFTHLTRTYGWDLDVDQGLLVVGAPQKQAGAIVDAGRIHIYERDPNTNAFVFLRRLDRRDNTERLFGHGVGVDNGYIFVGAPHNDGPQNLGAGYLYQRVSATSTNWVLIEKLTRPVGTLAGLYGRAIGFQDGSAIVGAPAILTTPASNRGYAFMYRFGHNRAPVLMGTIDNQFGKVGVPFAFNVPPYLFFDPDEDDTLTLSVDFPDGANGLVFDGNAITGTPVSLGLYTVEITATDQAGAFTTTSFEIYIVDGVQLLLTPRGMWDLDNFGMAVTNSALAGTVWGGNANPDQDEWNNDQEYVFGGNPNEAGINALTIAPDPIAHAMLTYTRRTNDPDLTFQTEGTTDFVTWFNVETRIRLEIREDIADDVECVILHVDVDKKEPFLHYRIRVTWP